MVRVSGPWAVLLMFMATMALTTAFQSSLVTPSSFMKKELLVCPSLHASRHASPEGVQGMTMGFRDKMRNVLGAIGAAITIGSAPPSASAAGASATVTQPPAQEQTTQGPPPPMLLPSQVAYYRRLANGGDNQVVATVKRVAKDPKFLGAVGVVAAGSGAFVVYQNMEKKKAEELRSILSSQSGINIDASILDEGRINRPGAKSFSFSKTPAFGTYRPPPEKLMKDVRDKYVWKKEDADTKEEEDLASKMRIDIFDSKKNGDIPNTNGDTLKRKRDLDAPEVEIVDGSDGPKTAEQKQLERELNSMDMDEVLKQAMAGDRMMDPSMMAAAIPMLQEQLQDLIKGGISKEEINEAKRSFTDMGMDLEEVLDAIEKFEKTGMSSGLGPDAVDFFKTLRKILKNAE